MKRSAGYMTPKSPVTRSYATKRSRTPARGRRRAKGTGVVSFPFYGFPTKLKVRHKYVDTVNLSGTAGALVAYQFRCNGMYDPDYTGTGHQPLYFDQLTGIYNHYTVTKAWLRITVLPTSTSPMLFNVFQNDDITITPSTLEARTEQTTGKTVSVIPGTSTRPIYLKYDAYKTFGGSLLANDNLQGSASADPTEQSIWSCTLQSPDLTVATKATIFVEILYEAIWDELKDVAGS